MDDEIHINTTASDEWWWSGFVADKPERGKRAKVADRSFREDWTE